MSNRHAPQRIVLVGLMGSGKTAVARLLARRLGRPWSTIDTDDMIVADDGRQIPQIFTESGEAEFRARERTAIARLERSEQIVISTGGGAPLDPINRRRLWQNALVVYLKAHPETLAGRVSGGGRSTESRPLLAGGDALARLHELTAQRTPFYELADWTIQTDALFPDQVADELLYVHQRLGEQLVARAGRERAWQEQEDAAADPNFAARVRTPTAAYPIYTGPGELAHLGERMGAVGLKGRATVVSDERVAALYGETALGALRGAGFEAEIVSIPAGEEQKHLGTVARVYDRLIERRSERSDPIVALGGGVAT
ncbi:MAG TPA: shikimate kinase, partial [Dehalococcoidia bacterium]